jgi:hypothetical protein
VFIIYRDNYDQVEALAVSHVRSILARPVDVHGDSDEWALLAVPVADPGPKVGAANLAHGTQGAMEQLLRDVVVMLSSLSDSAAVEIVGVEGGTWRCQRPQRAADPNAFSGPRPLK